MSPASVNRLDTAQVLAALAQLDETFQAPVALFYLQDCSYNEIAEILEVPMGTVKSRLTRGLGRLHEMLTGGTQCNAPINKFVNHDEAKTILMLYRPGTADAEDPQIAGALALAKREPELARWLEEHSARQETLRSKFRQITVPAGLKEQIISEQAAFLERHARREKIVAVAAVAAIVVSLIVLAPFWLPRRATADNTLANYENQMVRRGVERL